MSCCKHCKKEFDLSDKPKGWMANHSRWCLSNPKRKDYEEKLNDARSSIKTPKNQYIKAKEEGREIVSPLKGKATTRTHYTHSDEVKEVIRQRALTSKHRRLLKSTREYKQVDGTTVLLDSTWEEVLAKRLDSLGVRWTRPLNPIKWIDESGRQRNYFPDFYLIDYDIFLDPKNPYAYKVQQEKIMILRKQLSNLIILKTLKECEEFTVGS